MTFVGFHSQVVKTLSFGSNYLSFFLPFSLEIGKEFPLHISVHSLLFFMSILKRPFMTFAQYPQDFRELKLWLTTMVNTVPPSTF